MTAPTVGFAIVATGVAQVLPLPQPENPTTEPSRSQAA